MPNRGLLNHPRQPQAYPRQATLWHDESTALVGSALSPSSDVLQRYGAWAFQSSPAVGDTFEQAFWLAAGTYTLRVLGLTNTFYGIVSWYLDGVYVGQMDWYSNPAVYNVTQSLTGVPVLGDGNHVIRGVISGKNVNSSNYSIVLTRLQLS